MEKRGLMCRKFGLVNSAIQLICKNRTQIMSACEQNRFKIKQLQKLERSDIDEVLLKWFKKERSVSVLLSVAHPMVTSS